MFTWHCSYTYLDIVKVRLQTSDQYRNALECATRIAKDEGPLAFYKVCPLTLGIHELPQNVDRRGRHVRANGGCQADHLCV